MLPAQIETKNGYYLCFILFYFILFYIALIVLCCSILFYLILFYSWTVPEDFRVWKEKMDAIEKKKLIASQAPLVDASKTIVFSALPVASTGAGAGVAVTAVANIVTSNLNLNSNSNSNSNGVQTVNVTSNTGSVSTAPVVSTGSKKRVVEEEDLPIIIYATQEEAVEAFKGMLTEKRVSQ